MAIITLKGAKENETKINNDVLLKLLKNSSPKDLKVYLLLSMFNQHNMILDFNTLINLSNLKDMDIFTSCENLDRDGFIKLESLESDGNMVINLNPINKNEIINISSLNNIESANNTIEGVTTLESESTDINQNNSTLKINSTKIEVPEIDSEISSATKTKNLLDKIEIIYKAPLSPTLSRFFIELKDDFIFNDDLIIYLASISKERDSFNVKYMEKIAVAWKEMEVDTLDKALIANMETSNKRVIQKEILRYLGLDGKLLSEYHKDFMNRWIDEYNMSKEMILKACELTLKSINKADFSYIEKILSNWQKENIYKLEDIKVKESPDFNKINNNSNTNGNNKSYGNKYPPKKSVTNYKQREYSESIESMLFGFNDSEDGNNK